MSKMSTEPAPDGEEVVSRFERECGFGFSKTLRRVLTSAFDSSNKPDAYPVGLSTDRVFVSAVIMGKNRSNESTSAARAYKAIGPEVFEQLKFRLTQNSIPSNEAEMELENNSSYVSDTFRKLIHTAWANRDSELNELTLDQLVDQFVRDPDHPALVYLFEHTDRRWSEISAGLMDDSEDSELPIAEPGGRGVPKGTGKSFDESFSETAKKTGLTNPLSTKSQPLSKSEDFDFDGLTRGSTSPETPEEEYTYESKGTLERVVDDYSLGGDMLGFVTWMTAQLQGPSNAYAVTDKTLFYFLLAYCLAEETPSKQFAKSLTSRGWKEIIRVANTFSQEIPTSERPSLNSTPIAKTVIPLFEATKPLVKETGKEDIEIHHMLGAFIIKADTDLTGTHWLDQTFGHSTDQIRGKYFDFVEDIGHPEIIEMWKRLFTSGSPSQPVDANNRGTYLTSSREVTGEELGIGIGPLSDSIQTLFETTPADTDLIFALYGPWGRGKTTLMNEVRKKLKKSKIEDYAFVDFSAWKYPTRPEVWVHLYETMAEQAAKIEDTDYVEGRRRCRLRELQIGFRCGILKTGWLPIYVAVICLALTQVPFLDAYVGFTAFLGVSGFAALLTFLGKATNLGRSVAQRYLALPDHSSQLGMQAVIGKDLDDLLRIWIEPKKDDENKEAMSDEAPNTSSKPKTRELDLVDLSGWKKGARCYWGMLWILLAAFALSYVPPLAKEVKKSPTESVTYQVVSELPPHEKLTPDSASAAIQKGRIVAIEETFEVETKVEKEVAGLFAKPKKERITLLLLMALVIGFGLFVRPRPETRSKLLLVIDDLDRCRPDQMLSVIESLRLFLDNPGMKSRLQIAMLVDDRLLGHALLRRAKEDGIALEPEKDEENEEKLANLQKLAATYIREQREKLFLAELALSELSQEDLEGIALKYLPDKATTPKAGKQGETDGTTPNPDSSPIPDDNFIPDSGRTPESNPTPDGTPNPDTVRTSDGNLTQEDESGPEERFHDDEIQPLREAIVSMQSFSPTPRQLRTFLARYQLARLLLDNQEFDFDIPDLVNGITHELRLGDTQAKKKEVRQIARIVVCPPSIYADNFSNKSEPDD